MNIAIHFEIPVQDMERAIRFYEGVFETVLERVQIDGNEMALFYRSSEWAERGFCPTCGTHLFYHLLPTDEYILSAGLFQDQGFELTGQIFIDEKPDFYALKNDTPTLTGQQVFEQFAPKP
ncbi:GFA family protein [Aeromonas caviae]|uniref:hypothetical protein n=1 Tax=Aeromonas caviae TaxID=648 RepID=UPI00224EF3B8|nr:hypothetical protein [Aeromonas caviae]MCX4072726.1 hypothetical protein [Aeromonas caviae]